jgi:hypothetical protein
VDGDYLFRVMGYGGQRRLACRSRRAPATPSRGGIRLVLMEALELAGTFYLDPYNVPLDGVTRLSNAQFQYTNASASDRIMGALLSAGVAF